ncbi:Protein transport protein S9 plasma membrane t-SNARE [Thoreauomyces humboldtii]|nr:Protein transport protein S9 plasma membrane t-SNARE [Thoreauomyces humboldtii]
MAYSQRNSERFPEYNPNADRTRQPQGQGQSRSAYGGGSASNTHSSSVRHDYREDDHARSMALSGGANKWTNAAAAAEQSSHDNGMPAVQRSWETVDEEEEDYENEGWLDRKTKKVQNDSLMSSRRAVERLHATDAVATDNMAKLSYQSEQLYKAEGRLESAQTHVKVSDAKADHLKSLNRFFMLPSFGSKKAKKREAIAKKESEERAFREDERKLGEHDRAVRLGRIEDIQTRNFALQQGTTYSTPQFIERDDTEREIDDNLDQLSSGLAKLKMMGQVMNTELDAQRGQVNRIMDRSDITAERLNVTTNKVNRMLR